MNVPKSIVEKINALPERPDISGVAYNVGVVRFNKKGAPSYALQYSSLRASIEGIRQQGQFQRHVSGSGTMRGFMAAKYERRPNVSSSPLGIVSSSMELLTPEDVAELTGLSIETPAM